MEVVQRLPKPQDPAALARLFDAQRLLCGRCVSEEDCEAAQALLEELASPAEAGGFGYFPAWLTLASLFETGFEPAIEQDGSRAAGYYLKVLTHAEAASGLSAELLDEAATQLCSLVKDGRALLGEEALLELGRVGQGEAGGAAGSVASWARFAHAEGERWLREAREDPAVREERLARKAAREALRAEQLAEQRSLAQGALAKAEDLRLQGNDAYRQGQMPGNSRARADLSQAAALYREGAAALEDALGRLTIAVEDAEEVRRQRATLYSNASQVQIAAENWAEAAELARHALRDDAEALKPRYRLGRALVGLKDWAAAAGAVDGALDQLAKDGGRDADDMKRELWKLAEEISQALPSFRWSHSKPEDRERRPAEDHEKRIVGVWEYGPPGSMQCYEVVLEKWGALYWKEKDMRIDLLRKSKLRWRGEYEMVSGMVLEIAYEPGSDVLVTDFTPPTDIPEEQQWKGPTKFTARRVAGPPADAPEPEAAPEPMPAPAPAPAAAPAPASPEETPGEPEEFELPCGTPAELWLAGGGDGGDDFVGRYELLPGAAPPGARPGSSAVYRRAGGRGRFLWLRGGNWVVTESLNGSSLAAPFLARCPDPSGRTRQPMEVRRPRWYLRKGRGQEELDPRVALQPAAPPEAPRAAAGGPARTPDGACDGGAAPAAVVLSGRAGRHADVNGRYDLSASLTWRSLPVYVQADYPLDQERPLLIFFDGAAWVVTPELSSVPRAVVARRRAGGAPSHPAAGGGVWEFLSSEESLGSMVTTSSRTFSVDRAVVARAADADGAAAPLAPSPAPPQPSPCAPAAAAAAAGDGGSVAARPCWVSAASAEADGEVRASIVVGDGVDVDLEHLDLDVAAQVLRVALRGAGPVFELALPSPVDVSAPPKARWHEKTRTLKVRLVAAVQAAAECDTDGMD